MFAYNLSIFILILSRFTDAVLPAKHQSTCILCATDTNAIRWRRATSLLSLLQHTMKMQQSDWTGDCFVPTSVPRHLLTVALDFTGLDALFLYSLLLAGQNCFCLAAPFFTDADTKCASSLCHVYGCICLKLHRMDAACLYRTYAVCCCI